MGTARIPPTGASHDVDFTSFRIAHRTSLFDWNRAHGPVLLLEPGHEGIFHWTRGDFTEALRADPQQAIYVASSEDPHGKEGVWKRAVETDIHLSWFGAKCDVQQYSSIAESTDDTEAWKAALDYLGFIGGGTLHLPHGASKVTREITIRHDAIRIVGSGTRKVYPGPFKPGTNCPSTLVPVHNERNAIRFISTTATGGAFCAENFSIATLERGDRPEAAFGWEVQNAFLYGFTFRQIAIHGFSSAFDCYKGEGKEYAVGAVLIDDCVINRNQWIVRSLDKAQFNGFRFTNNKAGQNGYLPREGGIAISGQSVTIENNILEATRDAVFVRGAYSDVSVKGNYFEANVGNACVHLRDILGPYSVGPNNYSLLNDQSIDHKVLLTFCGLGSCIDPYWPFVTHKLPSPLIGSNVSALKNAVDSAKYGYCRMDRLDGTSWSVPPPMLSSATTTRHTVKREINPQTGFSMPVREFRSSDISYADHRFTIAGEPGEWAVVSWLFKRRLDGGPPADPYVSIRVNGGVSGGSRDYVAFGFSKSWRDGEWCLMTLAIRLQTRMSSMQLLLHPHGVKAPAGRVTCYLEPSVYTVADVNDILPFIDNRLASSVKAPPTNGEWMTGDVLYNATPAPGATFFVCTEGGSPGTWIAD